MPLTSTLRHFERWEFKHPELINDRAAVLLDEVREATGFPLTITDDARPPGDLPPGASPTSWHFKGQAFDLRIRDWTADQLWKFVAAVVSIERRLHPKEAGVELELVWSGTDKHAHLAFTLDPRPSRFLVRAE